MTTPPTTPPQESVDRQVDPTRQSLMWRWMRLLARPAVTLLFELNVYGRKYVPRKGGVLLVANHQSYLDPVLIGVYLARPMSYLAKSELFANRHFGWFIRSLNAFPVKQGAGDVGAVRETIRRLREGHMLSIFPEGSRTEDGTIGPMLPGAALVVKKAGVPIVPVAIHGSYNAWPKGHRIFHPGYVSLMYGPPMDVSGLKADQITQLIDRTLRAMHAEVRCRHEQRRRSQW